MRRLASWRLRLLVVAGLWIAGCASSSSDSDSGGGGSSTDPLTEIEEMAVGNWENYLESSFTTDELALGDDRSACWWDSQDGEYNDWSPWRMVEDDEGVPDKYDIYITYEDGTEDVYFVYWGGASDVIWELGIDSLEYTRGGSVSCP